MSDPLLMRGVGARTLRALASTRRLILVALTALVLGPLASAQPTATTGKGTVPRIPDTPCVWERLADGATPRAEAPSVVHDGKLLVFSGFVDAALNVTKRVDAYDPITNQWTQRSDMPSPVTHSGVARDGNNVWFIGGFTGQSPGAATNQVWIYNASTNRGTGAGHSGLDRGLSGRGG